MKAFLKNYRQSPQKVRLVAKSVVGKTVEEANLVLSFMPKRAALPLQKLILSAASNAKDQGISTEGLKIASLEVNKGVTLKRIRPRARGSAFRINKRTSNVTVTLKDVSTAADAPKAEEKKAAPAKKEVAKKAPAKKTAAKKVAKKKVAKKADK
jgi:large subunit ribosomal protein L22